MLFFMPIENCLGGDRHPLVSISFAPLRSTPSVTVYCFLREEKTSSVNGYIRIPIDVLGSA